MDTCQEFTFPILAFELQWSHDLSAMDTTRIVRRKLKELKLQWSHDLSAMDTTLSSRIVCQNFSSFNGAMTSQPWIP